MTTKYHTPLSETARISATGETFNGVFSDLDSAVGTVADSVTTLDTTLSNKISATAAIASGIKSSTTTATVAAGAIVLPVADATQFVDNSYIAYQIADGSVEYRKIASIASNDLTLDAVTGGQVANGGLVTMVTVDQVQAAGAYSSLSSRLGGIDGLPGALRLSAAVTSGATTVSLRSGADLSKALYLVIDPYTSNAEMRKITGYSGTTATIAALSSAHAADAAVIWVDRAEWSVLLWGVTGDNVTDDATRINYAITEASAAGGGDLRFPNGNYLVGASIENAAKVNLILSDGASIRTTSNVDIVKIARNSRMEGGTIDATGAATFTKSAILLEGGEQFYFDSNEHVAIENIRIYGPQTGNGIGLINTNAFDRVTACKFHNIMVGDFEYGLYMDSTPADTYITANMFSNIFINRCAYHIYMDGETDGNTFSNVHFQVRASSEGIGCIRCIKVLEGKHNLFTNCFLWDPQHTASRPLIEFMGTTEANKVDIYADHETLQDYGSRNLIHGIERNTWPQISAIAPFAINDGAHGSILEDAFAFADKRFTVAATGGTLVSGTVANTFDLTTTSLRYNSLPLTIEVDFGAGNIEFIDSIGVTMVKGELAVDIDIELWDGSSWLSLYSITDNTSTDVIGTTWSKTFGDRGDYRNNTLSKARIVFNSLVSGHTQLGITKIFCFAGGHYGHNAMYVPPSGAVFLDEATFQEPPVFEVDAYATFIGKRTTGGSVAAVLRDSSDREVSIRGSSGHIEFYTDDDTRFARMNDGGDFEIDSGHAVNAASGYKVGANVGVSGSFTTVDSKTVTVTNGIITAIV